MSSSVIGVWRLIPQGFIATILISVVAYFAFKCLRAVYYYTWRIAQIQRLPGIRGNWVLGGIGEVSTFVFFTILDTGGSLLPPHEQLLTFIHIPPSLPPTNISSTLLNMHWFFNRIKLSYCCCYSSLDPVKRDWSLCEIDSGITQRWLTCSLDRSMPRSPSTTQVLSSTYSRHLVRQAHTQDIWYVKHILKTSGTSSTYSTHLVRQAHTQDIWYVKHIFKTSSTSSTYSTHMLRQAHTQDIWYVKHILNTSGTSSTYSRHLVRQAHI